MWQRRDGVADRPYCLLLPPSPRLARAQGTRTAAMQMHAGSGPRVRVQHTCHPLMHNVPLPRSLGP